MALRKPAVALALMLAFAVSACTSPQSTPARDISESIATNAAAAAQGALTLAFAGDVHFEEHLAGLLDRADATLGPLSRHLRQADLAMVNLESALTTRGRRTSKERETPSNRYWFRSAPAALDLLDRSGVDVVSVANNHGADYGLAGLRQTLSVADTSPVAVVGVGKDAAEAYAPHEVRVKGTDIAVLAADASFRESGNQIWAANKTPGIASARRHPPSRLVRAVEAADEDNDIVVVYLHWGRELQDCPTPTQRRLASTLAAAGVLKVHIADGEVVGHDLVPGLIPRAGGRPREVRGPAARRALADWTERRACTNLAPVGVSDEIDEEEQEELPRFTSRIRRIWPALRTRMRKHLADQCPVGFTDLRHLSMSYVDFRGRHRHGRMVVHADDAEDVVSVFRELYDARWPIRQMRLVNFYDANDNRSMAANNTSAFNCRNVAGSNSWSDHAYGAAIDINPVQNPYVTTNGILPPKGRRFANVDRSPGANVRPGVITEDDVVVRAFARIGWSWGGDWNQPDYQHFYRP